MVSYICNARQRAFCCLETFRCHVLMRKLKWLLYIFIVQVFWLTCRPSTFTWLDKVFQPRQHTLPCFPTTSIRLDVFSTDTSTRLDASPTHVYCVLHTHLPHAHYNMWLPNTSALPRWRVLTVDLAFTLIRHKQSAAVPKSIAGRRAASVSIHWFDLISASR